MIVEPLKPKYAEVERKQIQDHKFCTTRQAQAKLWHQRKRWWEELHVACQSRTSLKKQICYLFDIVASLCAGFNEHDIQFLSSLLALLRGDLSAPAEAEVGRWTKRKIWKETSQRGRTKRRRNEETRRAQHKGLVHNWDRNRQKEVKLKIEVKQLKKNMEGFTSWKSQAGLPALRYIIIRSEPFQDCTCSCWTPTCLTL